MITNLVIEEFHVHGIFCLFLNFIFLRIFDISKVYIIELEKAET
jgi:hypothetical protein